jgi:hypothetical protein
MTAWDIAGVTQQESEIEIPEDDLSSIRAAVDELEQVAKDSDITPELRNLVLAQVRALRVALEMYKVQGYQVFEDALTNSIGVYVFNREIIEASAAVAPEATDSLFRKWGGVFGKVADVCGKVKKMRDGLQVGLEIARLFGPYVALLLTHNS